MAKKVKYPFRSRMCEGDKIVQSENGDRPIECPRCEAKGTYNPYSND